jgi:hypothetical protein
MDDVYRMNLRAVDAAPFEKALLLLVLHLFGVARLDEQQAEGVQGGGERRHRGDAWLRGLGNQYAKKIQRDTHCGEI